VKAERATLQSSGAEPIYFVEGKEQTEAQVPLGSAREIL